MSIMIGGNIEITQLVVGLIVGFVVGYIACLISD